MKNNYVPATIAAAIALLAWLFLPFMEVSILFVSESVSIFELITEWGEVFGEGEIEDLLILVPVLAGVLAVIGGFAKKKLLTMISSIVSVIAIVLIVLAFMGEGGEFSDVTELMGAGFWLGLVGFLASAILASCVGNSAEQA